MLNHDISADLIRSLGHDPQELLVVGESDVVLATGTSSSAIRSSATPSPSVRTSSTWRGYAVAWAAREVGVPVRLVKHVSDAADESAMDWPSMVEASAVVLGEWQGRSCVTLSRALDKARLS